MLNIYRMEAIKSCSQTLCQGSIFVCLSHVACYFHIAQIRTGVLVRSGLHMSHAMRKPDFSYAKTKMQISFAVTAKLISTFVFATQIVQFLLYVYPNFQAFNLLLGLYRLVCVGPGRNSRRPIFSRRGSYNIR